MAQVASAAASRIALITLWGPHSNQNSSWYGLSMFIYVYLCLSWWFPEGGSRNGWDNDGIYSQQYDTDAWFLGIEKCWWVLQALPVMPELAWDIRDYGYALLGMLQLLICPICLHLCPDINAYIHTYLHTYGRTSVNSYITLRYVTLHYIYIYMFNCKYITLITVHTELYISYTVIQCYKYIYIYVCEPFEEM